MNARVAAVEGRACELVGDLDGPAAAVGTDGTVEPVGSAWGLSWAVGTAQRWHVAAHSTAVRTHLLDDMPVCVTAMRVAGGDVVLRVAAGRAATQRALVLEFANDTSEPVSLALAVSGTAGATRDAAMISASTAEVPARRRPARRARADAARRAGPIDSAAVNGICLLVDGAVAADLGRAPGGAVAVDNGDVWRAVEAHPPPGDCEARSEAGSAAAAAILALAPRVPLRVVVPVRSPASSDSGHVSPAPSAPHSKIGDVGSPTEIAAGWLALVARAASIDVTDDTADRSWRRGVAAAILAAGSTEVRSLARAALVLDQVGLPDEADRARQSLGVTVDDNMLTNMLTPASAHVALRALASRRLRAGRESGLAELAGPLAETAAGGSCLDTTTLEQVAAALESEAPASARDARRVGANTRALTPNAAGTGGASPASTAVGSPTGSIPGSAGGRRAGGARDGVVFGGDGLAGIESLLVCLIAEEADGLVMLPAPPEAWQGAPLDARHLVTRHGVLSFSVRWHGPRPALLWDLAPPAQRRSSPVLLRCGLDPSWKSVEPAGEALLRT